MPPKIDNPNNEDHLFLLSCLHNADTPNWQEIATLNGIADSASLPAKKQAQRKFKKIVDASGKYKLENGKVVLKDGDGLSATSTPGTPGTPTPTTPVSGKKRGRKAAAAGGASSNKKAKKGDDNDGGAGEGMKKEGDGEDGDEAGEDAV